MVRFILNIALIDMCNWHVVLLDFRANTMTNILTPLLCDAAQSIACIA